MMIHRFIALLLLLPSFAAVASADVLRFSNGDQLHGNFAGIAAGSSVRWSREDVEREVTFKSSELRQIVLRDGRPARSLQSLSHIGTTNGDRIPGIVRELDGERVRVETEFGGLLEVPRDQVGLLAPNPLGGRVLYHGPFDPEEWTMVSAEYPDGLPQEKKGDDPDLPRWEFGGSAWFWQNEGAGTALIRKEGMPDRAVLQFDLAWKNNLAIAVAFHADFKRPEPEVDKDEEDEDVRHRGRHHGSYPELFGSSYVLTLNPNHVRLNRTYFDDKGHPVSEAVQGNHSAMQWGHTGNVRVELRCNRLTGEIILFMDGEFVMQWSEIVEGARAAGRETYAGKGNGIGFQVQGGNSPVRISEIVIAEWNGMPDAARSLQVDAADIVLLTNGTDRFSGSVTEVRDGQLKLEGRYGEFVFPMEEVAEVRFAKAGLQEQNEAETEVVKVRFYPIGLVTGQPLEGDNRSLRILSTAAGEIDMNLDSAVMLEFQSTESFLDDWDPEF